MGDEHAEILFHEGNKVLELVPENIWIPERKMTDWELGKRPRLFPDDEDDEMDNVLRPVAH